MFDSTNKGYFTEQELKDVANNRLKCEFSAEEVREMILVADLDGDQRINFEEFVRIMLTQEWLSNVDINWIKCLKFNFYT